MSMVERYGTGRAPAPPANGIRSLSGMS